MVYCIFLGCVVSLVRCLLVSSVDVLGVCPSLPNVERMLFIIAEIEEPIHKVGYEKMSLSLCVLLGEVFGNV